MKLSFSDIFKIFGSLFANGHITDHNKKFSSWAIIQHFRKLIIERAPAWASALGNSTCWSAAENFLLKIILYGPACIIWVRSIQKTKNRSKEKKTKTLKSCSLLICFLRNKREQRKVAKKNSFQTLKLYLISFASLQRRRVFFGGTLFVHSSNEKDPVIPSRNLEKLIVEKLEKLLSIILKMYYWHQITSFLE